MLGIIGGLLGGRALRSVRDILSLATSSGMIEGFNNSARLQGFPEPFIPANTGRLPFEINPLYRLDVGRHKPRFVFSWASFSTKLDILYFILLERTPEDPTKPGTPDNDYTVACKSDGGFPLGHRP